MQLKLTWKYLLAFGALILLLKELHELSHILTSYLFFKCWGAYRDFNVITMCNAAGEGSFGSLVSALNGPIFSYACMWVGMTLLLRNSASQKWLGFSLLFATKPFARLFTALANGGDELGVLRTLLSSSLSPGEIQLLGIGCIVILILPPLWIAYRNILNPRKTGWFVAFFFLPMLYDFAVAHTLLNQILKAGVLADPLLFATPLIIHVVFLLNVLLLMGFGKVLLGPQKANMGILC